MLSNQRSTITENFDLCQFTFSFDIIKDKLKKILS